jgi:hypothetical protein
MLFSAYRRDDFTDAEGFAVQLGTVLADFPEEVVTYVTSPKTGLQRRMKWPPTISEVLDACEQHQDYLNRLRQPQRAPLPQLESPRHQDLPQGALAQVFVPEGHPRYAVFVKWTEKAPLVWWKFGASSDGRKGLWVSWKAWNGEMD